MNQVSIRLSKHIPCLILLMLVSIMMQGQTLSSLGKAKEITDGTLPNGISYYIVTNPCDKGFADFALVQRGIPDLEASRKVLSVSPVFGGRKPYRFLADHGVGYGPRGFISYEEESTRFDFAGVPVYDEAVADSTLMMIFGIADSNRYGQALVISGDVDARKMADKLKMFSMMVSPRSRYTVQEPYQWNPRDTLAFRITNNSTDDVAVINLIYSTERIARENLDSPVPLVTSMYSEELGLIAGRRLRAAFRKADVPLADLRYKYSDSAAGPEDERYSFSVYTSASRLKEATAIVASVFSSIDKDGVSKEELQDAKDRLVSEAVRKTKSARLSNAQYVDKCVAAYLYGTNLASEETINGFLAGKRLSESRELDLFNGFAKALIDSTRNLTLRFDIPMGDTSRDDILPVFHSAWAGGGRESGIAFKANYGDTLGLKTPSAKSAKVKLRTEVPDPVSGGSLWTFSNGIKVIFKRVAGSGEFNYALLMRGGYSDVDDLLPGEGAFVGDMLALNDVSGMTGTDFHEMLLANGITMEEQASLSDLRITGTAPSGKINLLLKSLLSYATDNRVNLESFDWYCKCEALRLSMGDLSPRDVNSLMDNILFPDYKYTDHKDIRNLGEALPVRTEKYFNRQFSKIGDGVLVLVGDLEPEYLKKLLSRSLGDFRTDQKFSPRPNSVSKTVKIGTTTKVAESGIGLVGAGEIGVNMAATVQMPFTLTNYMAFKVAVAVLEKELTKVLAGQGAYIDVSDRAELFPVERMMVYVGCKPCFASGLPEEIMPADPLDLLEAVRRAVAQAAEKKVSDADVTAYKSALVNEVNSSAALPSTIMENVMVRYGEGKDVVSGFKDAVGAVSAAKVSEIIAALAEGSRVEYVLL